MTGKRNVIQTLLLIVITNKLNANNCALSVEFKCPETGTTQGKSRNNSARISLYQGQITMF